MSVLLTAGLVTGLAMAPAAQTSKPPVRRGPPPATAPIKTVPDMQCPNPLGTGIESRQLFCDVMVGRDPAAGIVIKIPPHAGPVTLTFDLHNRHTYSEEQVKANRAYSRYTATIGVLTPDGTLVSRAVVQNEFRNTADIVDRIGGGAGPGGVKAVVPTGTEPISITIPEQESQVSILGEKLTVERLEGTTTYTTPGRPVAVISGVMIEYRPAPPPKPRPAPRRGAPAR